MVNVSEILQEDLYVIKFFTRTFSLNISSGKNIGEGVVTKDNS